MRKVMPRKRALVQAGNEAADRPKPKKRKSLRAVSLKRQKLNKEVKPWRDALKEQVGRCEYCLKPRMPDELCIHEIARGGHRRKALASEFAVLVVCKNPWGQPPCHDTVQLWSEAKQLALLYLVRQSSFRLNKYNALVNPRAMNRITWREVDREMRLLLEVRPKD